MTARCYLKGEVMALLKMSRQTFDRLHADGKLPFVEEITPRAGRPRYLAGPVDRYLNNQWQKPQLAFGRRR